VHCPIQHHEFIFSSAAIGFLSDHSRAAGFLSYTFRRVRSGDEFIVTLPPMLLSVYAPNPSSSSPLASSASSAPTAATAAPPTDRIATSAAAGELSARAL
jgi:hypothetical protein